jgi:hypothetical protein
MVGPSEQKNYRLLRYGLIYLALHLLMIPQFVPGKFLQLT